MIYSCSDDCNDVDYAQECLKPKDACKVFRTIEGVLDCKEEIEVQTQGVDHFKGPSEVENHVISDCYEEHYFILGSIDECISTKQLAH